MSESQYLKPFMVRIIVLTLTFLFLRGLIGLFAIGSYTEVLELNSDVEYKGVSDIEVVITNPSIIHLDDLWEEDGELHYTVFSRRSGDSYMKLKSKSSGEELASIRFMVYGFGSIRNRNNDNDSMYHVKQILMFLYYFSCTINIWYTYFHVQKVMLYSYQAVFFAGFGVWLTLLSVETFHYLILDTNMLGMYTALQRSGFTFMKYTTPFIVLFALSMSISNIALIRHEGARKVNFLGIGISFAMILGLCFGWLIYAAVPGGTETTHDINSVLLSTYTSIYCLFECFLIGAIICGRRAAFVEPKYDKDYIIILGCKVRPDGTLYPLIKGRVDRAIAFYQAQFENTRKQAIFVPSGGKGNDEQMSESEAMKKYLLEQGFTEDQILIENESKNTLQNMKFSKKLIKEINPDAKIAYSTTNFHVFRSGIISRQAGLRAQGMGAKTKWYFWPNAYVREMIGMMDYLKTEILMLLISLILFFAILALLY